MSETKTFQAKANAYFMVKMSKYDAFKKDRDQKLAELKSADPHATMVYKNNYVSISPEMPLTFGDKLILDEDTGQVMQYPKEIFDEYSKKMIEFPCKMHGNVEQRFKQIIDGLPEEERQSMLKKKEKLTARFDIQPMLALVA